MSQPIGIFDSGLGGLSVWREIATYLPHESLIYVADQLNLPYGERTPAQIRDFSHRIAEFLLDAGCKALVVACNSASAAALASLRAEYPNVPIIGMEPAVKPASELTRSGVIGVLATPATFKGKMFKATTERHASHLRILAQACPGLAELIEQDPNATNALEQALRQHLEPLLAAGADVIVLACTHYPLVRDMIADIVGPTCHLVDPAPAIARQVARVIKESENLGPERLFFTTGNLEKFSANLAYLLGSAVNPRQIHWDASSGALKNS